MVFKFFFCPVKKKATPAIYLLSFFFLHFSALQAQFSAGNLVVLQAGNGSVPLANTGNPIVLKEFTPLGTPVFSVVVSNTLTPLIISGSATSEGALSLSPNGKYLVFAGYATNFPYASSLSAATANAVNRGIGIMNAAGSFSRVAANTSFYSASNIRAATSDGLNNYWSAGGNNGTNYFGITSSSVTVQNANPNTRNVLAFNGGLYFSTGSGTAGIYKVGTGFPMTSGQTNSLIINTSTSGNGSASCFAFYFNPAQTICYVADDRSFANGGGIQKWIYNNGAWSLAYILNTIGSSGARGVVADFSGANPIVYATTDEGSSNRLVAINDIGAVSTATTLATATQNTIFRGLAFSPYCLEPQITSISSGTVCSGQTFTLSPTIIGTAPLSYTWIGPSSFSASVQNPTSTALINNNYSLSVSNGCGNASAIHSIIVNPLPNLTINSPVICPGGTVTLMVNGASSYTWNTSANTNTISVSPVNTTNYTVSGSSSQGCIVTKTTSVGVTNSLVLSANSASICSGNSATLIVSGAANYTWSTMAFTPVMTVNPITAMVYTVIGSAPGCVSIAVTTASVFVNPQPTITVNSAPICLGKTATLTASGGVNYVWSNQNSGPVIFVNPTVNTTYTVIGSSSDGCLDSVAVTVIVNPNPTTTLTTPSNPICMNGGIQTFTGMPQGGLFSGTAMNADQFDPATAMEGTFVITYKYTDSNNCEAIDSKTISVDSCAAVSLNERSFARNFLVYPVPASDELRIQDMDFKDTIIIEIINSMGVRCDLITLKAENTVINIHDYAPGIYFIKTNKGTNFLKFIKE